VIAYLSAVVGMSVLIITWAIGLNADVGGLIALGFVGAGLLAQKARNSSTAEPGS
jgi:hypothetical protein